MPIKLLLKSTYNANILTAENGKRGLEVYESDATKTCCKNYI